MGIFKPERFTMVMSLAPVAPCGNLGFSVFDQLSFSDRTLPFGNILSAEGVRELFAGQEALFGYGEDDCWSTGLTLWAFLGQLLQDGKQRSCQAAITHATRYRLEQGWLPPGGDSGD
jgi:hypothetical protein